jgi:hypothetical protein
LTTDADLDEHASEVTPVAAFGQPSPFINSVADRIDDRSVIVVLLSCCEPQTLVEHQGGLLTLPLLGFRNRRDEFGGPTMVVARELDIDDPKRMVDQARRKPGAAEEIDNMRFPRAADSG